jgi:hypothetical protein
MRPLIYMQNSIVLDITQTMRCIIYIYRYNIYIYGYIYIYGHVQIPPFEIVYHGGWVRRGGSGGLAPRSAWGGGCWKSCALHCCEGLRSITPKWGACEGAEIVGPLFATDTQGNAWKCMDINGYPWFCMDIHGYPWISTYMPIQVTAPIHSNRCPSMPIHGPEGRRPLRDPYGTLTGPLGKHRPNTDPPNDAIWACLANLPLGAFQNRVRREVRRIYIYI